MQWPVLRNGSWWCWTVTVFEMISAAFFCCNPFCKKEIELPEESSFVLEGTHGRPYPSFLNNHSISYAQKFPLNRILLIHIRSRGFSQLKGLKTSFTYEQNPKGCFSCPLRPMESVCDSRALSRWHFHRKVKTSWWRLSAQRPLLSCCQQLLSGFCCCRTVAQCCSLYVNVALAVKALTTFATLLRCL